MTQLILSIINILIGVIVGQAILSWLMVAGFRNDIVIRLYTALGAITEPLMRPLRRVIPNFGMIDITPMVAIFILIIIRRLIASQLS